MTHVTRTKIALLATVAALQFLSGVHAAIVNPSFEADGDVDLNTGSITGWTDNVDAPFGGYASTSYYHSEGLRGVLLFSQTFGTFSAGNEAHLRQSFDLTGVGRVYFDARLETHSIPVQQPAWHSFIEAAVYLDAVKKWSSQTLGTYVNQSIDTSSLSGVHTLEFRLQAIGDGTGADVSNWFQFDNVRVPEPSTLALATVGCVAAMGCALRRRLFCRQRPEASSLPSSA